MELRINNLTKQYKNKIAVNKFSAEFKPGIYGLLGANGAGKTTLMRMVCGILKPTAGQIYLDNQDVAELSEEYRNILGYLPQDFGYYPNFTATKFLLYVAALKGIEGKYAHLKVQELLEMVGLKKEANKKIKSFSGGMKRRLGIAQALLNDPKILILDEPTAGLDPKERVRFRNLISSFSKEKIVLLSTHIVSDTEYIADDILVMKEGRIIHEGAPDEILVAIKDYVYEISIPNSLVDEYRLKYNVVNLRNSGNETILRIVSENKPLDNAINVEATLEDLYLYYFVGEEK